MLPYIYSLGWSGSRVSWLTHSIPEIEESEGINIHEVDVLHDVNTFRDLQCVVQE